jgi:L-ascorbate metabolism protein UlaG (beta-lactamase superfamily)
MSLRRRLLRALLLLTLPVAALALFALVDGWRAFGHRTEGARRERMEHSPQWHDGHFENPQPLRNYAWPTLVGLFHVSPDVSPASPVSVVTHTAPDFATPPASGLRVTWAGHSSTLVEIDGQRVLTDPVWSDRASPLTWVGPRRWYPPLFKLEDVGHVDAVVISHDHYDHLDYGTIATMKDWDTTFFVPLGLAAHLISWGVPEAHIVELDWWEHAKVGALELVCLPARHASGRVVTDKDATLWAGWGIVGPTHRVYYSGDTGLFPAMRDIGERYGPFDVTMIETGQYHAGWPDWHIGPEQAVIAHGLVRGKVMLPVHWGLFALAYHTWTEPPERVWVAARTHGATLVLPRPGEPVDPEAPRPPERWWPELPFESAQVAPIVSSQVD